MSVQHRLTPTHRRPRASRVLAALISVALSLVVATPAGAATRTGTQACPPDPDFSYTNVRFGHIEGPPHSQGPAGHHLTISITAGMTLTATATVTGSWSVSAIVAGAKVDVSASLALALTASVTYGDTWVVPAGVTQGYLAAGAASKVMDWTHGQYAGCRWVVDGHGTLDAPYHLPAFWSWTT